MYLARYARTFGPWSGRGGDPGNQRGPWQHLGIRYGYGESDGMSLSDGDRDRSASGRGLMSADLPSMTGGSTAGRQHAISRFAIVATSEPLQRRLAHGITVDY